MPDQTPNTPQAATDDPQETERNRNGETEPHGRERASEGRTATLDGEFVWHALSACQDEEACPIHGRPIETAEVIGNCDWCGQPFMTQAQQQRHDCPDAPDDAPSPACLRPDTCHPGDPCSPCLANGQHPAVDDTGLEPYYSAIEERIYQLRERTCQWDETDGTTQEIARQAAIAAKETAVDLENQLAAVRDLHRPQALLGVELCQACDVSWPCATIRALDGGAQ